MKKTTIIAAFTLACGTLYAQPERLIDARPIQPKARSVIYLYLDGGAAQTDTFDPKPEAGRDYCGNYRQPIPTNVPGLIIGERLVELAKIADKYSIIRGMTHGVNAHETAHYIMLTGDTSGGAVVYPSFGSMISYLKEDSSRGSLFPYVTITASSTRFNEAGFLPVQYKPFDTGGAPESGFFEVDGVISRKVSDDRLRERKSLFEMVNGAGGRVNASAPDVEALSAFRKKGYDLILGSERKIFDLSQEPDSLRQRYGTTRFGQSCLAARRLVEAGVPVVVIRYTGWDTHKEHFSRMNERLDDLDRGLSALLTDLDNRGLLDSTIVLCGGEFGRTPKIGWEPPWNGGRGHYGPAFSYLVAGGGFEGGKIVGKTDGKGETVVERKVYPCDLIGTVYLLMGIDPHAKVMHPRLGPVPLLTALSDPQKSNGLLTEIIKK